MPPFMMQREGPNNMQRRGGDLLRGGMNQGRGGIFHRGGGRMQHHHQYPQTLHGPPPAPIPSGAPHQGIDHQPQLRPRNEMPMMLGN